MNHILTPTRALLAATFILHLIEGADNLITGGAGLGSTDPSANFSY